MELKNLNKNSIFFLPLINSVCDLKKDFVNLYFYDKQKPNYTNCIFLVYTRPKDDLIEAFKGIKNYIDTYSRDKYTIVVITRNKTVNLLYKLLKQNKGFVMDKEWKYKIFDYWGLPDNFNLFFG